MAILKSFDSTNYETKSITLAVTAGGNYTLGDAYTGGGRVVDIWIADGFVSSTGKVDIDFVLSGIDSRLTTDYGITCYTTFKSLTITGTVTISYRCVGTYVDAAQINAHESRLDGHDDSLTDISASLDLHAARLVAAEAKNTEQDSSLSDHASRITVLESNPTIIVVADHATMIALTGLKTGTTVYVVADTDGKRAEYLYDGSAFQKTSDPDWENINLDWSALLNIPSGVAALIAGTLASTALADMPTPADTDDTKVLSWDKTTGKYKLLTVSAAAGVGDVAGPSSAVSGHIPLFSGTTGKIIEDSGVAPSDLYASACATQEVTTANVTITDVKKGTLILTGALTGNRIVYLPATVWRKTIICNCTGSYYIHVKTASGAGVYLAPGDAAEVYCDGTDIVLLRLTTPRELTMTRSGDLSVTANTETLVTFAAATGDALSEFGSNSFTAKNSGAYSIYTLFDVAGSGISGSCQVRILVNGVVERFSALYIASAGAVSTAYLHDTCDLKLSAGDVVTVNVKIEVGTSIAVRSWSYVSINQIN